MFKLYDGEVEAELEGAETGFGGREVAVGGGVVAGELPPEAMRGGVDERRT